VTVFTDGVLMPFVFAVCECVFVYTFGGEGGKGKRGEEEKRD